MSAKNVCQQCGACCACFRVSFYWSEATQLGLPEPYVEQLDRHRGAMAGTNHPAPRCRALQVDIGKAVTCLVYPARPSPCREIQPGDSKCAKARARQGLAPVT